MSEYAQKIARFDFRRDPGNGMLIGPDGCHYDSESEAMYFGQIGLCGCGDPDRVHQFLIDCLGSASDDFPSLLDVDKVQNLILSRPQVVAEFVLHFLDSVNLTEHGGSVYGSWLTDRGSQVLEIGCSVGAE